MNSESIIESDEFKKKLFERLNGISSKFKIPYPINPKISYEYPKINQIICQNIINCLVKYPKFYQQTLHLMNKMNLPCPCFPYIREPSIYQVNLNTDVKNSDILSSSESEIESDTEISSKIKRQAELEDLNQVKKLKVKSILKSMKLNTTSQKQVDMSQVFEKPEEETKTNKAMNLPKKLIYDRVVIESESHFPKILPHRDQIEEIQPPEKQIEIKETEKFIKKDDLEKNRLKLSELRDLPVFKNYERGDANSRIYLKNLSKKVIEDDLKFIYGRYIDWTLDEHKNAFDVRLMKEGRMKGQAFINLPNENLAEIAINETLGYLLDGKPIIVQFARSAKPQSH
ncbi:unnamed protein product [Brachionus calyciflorus]|uniref:RNA-binding region-containing protein 3 n=1 Tax=Brachionus calyciflorus TaxID=104777 RepID=A0A814IXB3_9BILA|nr:unnamed protein product [Brachionus calyciflorus]